MITSAQVPFHHSLTLTFRSAITDSYDISNAIRRSAAAWLMAAKHWGTGACKNPWHVPSYCLYRTLHPLSCSAKPTVHFCMRLQSCCKDRNILA